MSRLTMCVMLFLLPVADWYGSTTVVQCLTSLGSMLPFDAPQTMLPMIAFEFRHLGGPHMKYQGSPVVHGGYRPDAFTGTEDAKPISWRISMARRGGDWHQVRFEYDWCRLDLTKPTGESASGHDISSISMNVFLWMGGTLHI